MTPLFAEHTYKRRFADDELNELEAKAKAATPGTWNVKRAIDGHSHLTDIRLEDGRWIARTDPHYGRPHVNEQSQNAAFIAAMGPDVALNLIAELRREREKVKSLETIVQHFRILDLAIGDGSIDVQRLRTELQDMLFALDKIREDG